MDIKKVYYGGKCIMTVDMDYVNEDSMYEYLNEIFGMFQERAYREFDVEKRYESEARKVWEGNEDLYELKNQVEQELEQEFEQEDEQEIEADLFKAFEKEQEKLELLALIIRSRMQLLPCSVTSSEKRRGGSRRQTCFICRGFLMELF